MSEAPRGVDGGNVTVLNLQPDDARVKPRLVTPEDELHRLRNQVQALRLEDGLRNLKAQKRLERVIRIAKEFRAAGERALDAALVLTGENDRLRERNASLIASLKAANDTTEANGRQAAELLAEVRALKPMIRRRDTQIEALLRASVCNECDEGLSECVDVGACRCRECFALISDCACERRCEHCRAWDCASPDCAIVDRRNHEWDAGVHP